MNASARPKVICCWDMSLGQAILGQRLSQVADIQVLEPQRDLLKKHLPQARAYMASLHIRLDRELLDCAPNLRIIATPTTGLDHLDLEVIQQRGIQLISIKTEYELLDRVTATAEMAWGLLLACVRKLPAAAASASAGVWARDRFRGHQISGKTLGILGVGRLGKMVAAYGQAFRMPVLGCDVKKITLPWVKQVDLDTLLAQSDILSIHIHLTEDNRKLLSARRFAQMKDGIVLINTSRGGIIDEEAFLAALQSGKVSAAGLDIIEGEWRSDLADHPLIRYAREHDNLVIVPHVGGITWESQTTTTVFVADKLADALLALPARA